MTDYAAMPAGRKMDTLIATRVMGWTRGDLYWKSGTIHNADCAVFGWAPSNDMLATRRVMDDLVRPGCRYLFQMGNDRCGKTGRTFWFCAIIDNGTLNKPDHTEYQCEGGHSLPLAVCRAILVAKASVKRAEEWVPTKI